MASADRIRWNVIRVEFQGVRAGIVVPVDSYEDRQAYNLQDCMSLYKNDYLHDEVDGTQIIFIDHFEHKVHIMTVEVTVTKRLR